MDVFPAFYPLAGRRVVIAGNGEAAEAKARLFKGSPAEVVRVRDEQAFAVETYAGAVLAFVASVEDDFAARACAAARAAGVPVNVTDRPALCDFTTPALIDRGEVVAAIGTGGSAPLLASLLRADIEARVPEGAGWVAALLRRTQGEVRAAFPEQAVRRAFLRRVLAGPIAEAAMAGDVEGAQLMLRAAIGEGVVGAGRVSFVFAGGPADALTLGAARLLSEADAVAVDSGADPRVVALARRDARRLDDHGAEALAALARQGLQVVRLTARPVRKAEVAAVAALGVRASTGST
jgi:precorrin-2 dehydrogenase/sirohydrochlorin ferrochelatase